MWECFFSCVTHYFSMLFLAKCICDVMLLLLYLIFSMFTVFCFWPFTNLFSWFSSVQSLSHVWLFADPMNHSTPGLPVHHQLPELTQTYIHLVSDAIQPSHPVIPFSSCPQSLPASESFPVSQLFTWGGQSTGVSALASFLPKNTKG